MHPDSQVFGAEEVVPRLEPFDGDLSERQLGDLFGHFHVNLVVEVWLVN